jgi:phosphate transport system substrate-binding protein
MKNVILSAKIIASVAATTASAAALAAPLAIQGSDTLAGMMTDAIIAGGLDGSIQYIGGGSGKGEAALVAGTQGLAPMSKAFSETAKASASAKGISVQEHIIGLDAVGLWVKSDNGTKSLDLDTVRKIYTCEVTDWSAVSGGSGAIKVYARNDASGTTDVFKKLVKIDKFGPCVTALAETADIAVKTSNDVLAIGFSGLSAKRPQNRLVPLAASAGGEAFDATPANVRAFKYPLSRNVYVYEAKGSVTPGQAENQLLDLLLDPSFINPILLDHDFITVK